MPNIYGTPLSETLTGTGTDDNIYGYGGDDIINGGDGADVLLGGIANDTLDGGAGDDILIGGADTDWLIGGLGATQFYGGTGDDVFVVTSSNPADAVLNTIYELAGEGIDEVRTTASIFSLEWFGSSSIERLTLTDNSSHLAAIGNALDNEIRGGSGIDWLYGRAGDDMLFGGTGAANTLFGEAGNDVYMVDAAGDSVIEYANEGNDTVRTALSSFTLRDHVENLIYTGSASFIGIGSDGTNNVIAGGNGNDQLNGMGGDDIIIGDNGALFNYGGFDILQGGSGRDQFRYSGGDVAFIGALNYHAPDRILDFVSGEDVIVLSSNFVRTPIINFVQSTAPAPTDFLSTLMYNTATGVISYDPDGFGPAVALEIAQLNSGQTFAATDLIFL